jgi:hypothetical protein
VHRACIIGAARAGLVASLGRPNRGQAAQARTFGHDADMSCAFEQGRWGNFEPMASVLIYFFHFLNLFKIDSNFQNLYQI